MQNAMHIYIAILCVSMCVLCLSLSVSVCVLCLSPCVCVYVSVCVRVCMCMRVSILPHCWTNQNNLRYMTDLLFFRSYKQPSSDIISDVILHDLALSLKVKYLESRIFSSIIHDLLIVTNMVQVTIAIKYDSVHRQSISIFIFYHLKVNGQGHAHLYRQ